MYEINGDKLNCDDQYEGMFFHIQSFVILYGNTGYGVFKSGNAKLMKRRLLEIVFLFLQSVFFGVQNKPTKLILCARA